jgi:drug/metabolite transporter (DMT)-like permease
MSPACGEPMLPTKPATDGADDVGALLALVSSLSWGVADFAGGLAARRVGSAQVLSVSYPTGAILLTVLALFVIPGEITPAVLPYAVAAGVIGGTAMWLLYAALTRGPMGIVSPITAVMSGLIPVLVGVTRGEHLTLVAVLGMLGAAAAVVLVSRESGHPHERAPFSALAYAVAAGIAIGFYLVAIGLSPASAGIWTATLGRWLTSITMVVIVLVVIRKPHPRNFPWLLAMSAGTLDAFANGMFQLASQRGLLAIVAVIGSLYPAATVLLARFILHERMNRIQVTGVAAAFVSVVALTIG